MRATCSWQVIYLSYVYFDWTEQSQETSVINTTTTATHTVSSVNITTGKSDMTRNLPDYKWGHRLGWTLQSFLVEKRRIHKRTIKRTITRRNKKTHKIVEGKKLEIGTSTFVYATYTTMVSYSQFIDENVDDVKQTETLYDLGRRQHYYWVLSCHGWLDDPKVYSCQEIEA